MASGEWAASRALRALERLRERRSRLIDSKGFRADGNHPIGSGFSLTVLLTVRSRLIDRSVERHCHSPFAIRYRERSHSSFSVSLPMPKQVLGAYPAHAKRWVLADVIVFVMRLLLQLGLALVFTLFLPDASAQCCRRVCKPKPIFPYQAPPGPAVIARGTRVETKSTSSGLVAPWNVVGAKPVRYEGLELKILSGTAQRRLATVNNQTFVVGESQRVIVRGSEVRVRCLEIRDRSVLVEVQGEDAPRELKLRTWQ